jgi:hypothetical protein
MNTDSRIDMLMGDPFIVALASISLWLAATGAITAGAA